MVTLTVRTSPSPDPSQGAGPKTSNMTEGTLHKGQLTAGHLLASTLNTSETFSIQMFGGATKHTFALKKSVKITLKLLIF